MNLKQIYTTPEDYILAQDPERQIVLKQLEEIVLKNLPEGFLETIQYNMISFVIPKELYPKGYHCNPSEPLPFISLANQKNYISFYHMGLLANKTLKEEFERDYAQLNIGKLDMGKSCIRFKNFNKIPYELIGKYCTRMTPTDYINLYEKHTRK